jgi:ribose transport system permease protein
MSTPVRTKSDKSKAPTKPPIESTPEGRSARAEKSGGSSAVSKYGLAVFLVALFVIFSVLRPTSFPTFVNIVGILNLQSYIVIAALGVLLTMTVGEIDLSIAANMSVANALVVGLGTYQHLPLWLSVVLSVVASSVIGLANGIIVTRFKVPAFVATLGMATLLEGLMQLYMGGNDIVQPPPGLTDIARTAPFGIPLAIVYAAIVAVIVHFVINHMTVGRKMLAVGGNPRAAGLTGIPVDTYRVVAFTVGGALGGVAGVILGSQIGSAQVQGNAALLLPIFAATFLGSTVIFPGRFNVPGTVVAVLFLAVTVSGLVQLGVQPWIQPVFNGATLIAAVAVSAWGARSRAAKARREQISATASQAEAERPTA